MRELTQREREREVGGGGGGVGGEAECVWCPLIRNLNQKKECFNEVKVSGIRLPLRFPYVIVFVTH